MFATKKRIQQFAAMTVFPLVIFAATFSASAETRPEHPDVTKLTATQLNREFWYALGGTTGNCSVGAVLSLSAAIGEQIPGLSAIIKASASGLGGDDNRVRQTFAEVENSWSGEATTWLGGILSLIVEGVADINEYIKDRNLSDGARGEHQAGDAIAYGFSGTYEIARTLYGESSLCHSFAARFSNAAFEKYDRKRNPQYARAVELRLGTVAAGLPQKAVKPEAQPPVIVPEVPAQEEVLEVAPVPETGPVQEEAAPVQDVTPDVETATEAIPTEESLSQPLEISPEFRIPFPGDLAEEVEPLPQEEIMPPEVLPPPVVISPSPEQPSASSEEPAPETLPPPDDVAAPTQPDLDEDERFRELVEEEYRQLEERARELAEKVKTESEKVQENAREVARELQQRIEGRF